MSSLSSCSTLQNYNEPQLTEDHIHVCHQYRLDCGLIILAVAIGLNKVANTTSAIVPHDISFTALLEGMVSYANGFETEYGACFSDARINCILHDMTSSDFL